MGNNASGTSYDDTASEASPKIKESFDYCIKLLIIGDGSVGKTCLKKQFQTNNFPTDQSHTIGVEFASKIVKIGNKKVKLQLWDTAGLEKYRSVTRTYYNGAAGALIVYDVTSSESFANVHQWIQDVRTLAPTGLNIAIVGNKSDLKDKRVISFTEGSKYAQTNDSLFFETSAKSGDGVIDAFTQLAKSILPKVETKLKRSSLQSTGTSSDDLSDYENGKCCADCTVM